MCQAGYSSVGRASDCRHLQESDCPWFDSGWPDCLGSLCPLRAGTAGVFFPSWAGSRTRSKTPLGDASHVRTRWPRACVQPWQSWMGPPSFFYKGVSQAAAAASSRVLRGYRAAEQCCGSAGCWRCVVGPPADPEARRQQLQLWTARPCACEESLPV